MEDLKFYIKNTLLVLLIMFTIFVLWTILDIAFDRAIEIRNEVNQIDRFRDNNPI